MIWEPILTTPCSQLPRLEFRHRLIILTVTLLTIGVLKSYKNCLHILDLGLQLLEEASCKLILISIPQNSDADSQRL